MKMEYIILNKKAGQESQDEKVRNDILTLFESSDEKSFTFMHKDSPYAVDYSLKKRLLQTQNECAYVFAIFCDTLPSDEAVAILEAVHQQITSTPELRKKYYTIVLHDDISSYHCIRAYPLLQKFERTIRMLVYKLLVTTFGAFWLEKTIDKEERDKLKAMTSGLSDDKLIEQALQEMDISQLHDFLFTPRREKSLAHIHDTLLSEENTNAMSKEAILEVLLFGRPISIWDKFFAPNMVIDDLPKKINTIRQYRNKVAHCKSFSSVDFTKLELALEGDNLIDQMTAAATQIELADMSIVNLSFITSAFENMFATWRSSFLDLSGVSSVIANMGAAVQMPTVPNMSGITSALANMGAAVQMTAVPDMTGMSSALASMNDIQRAAIPDMSGISSVVANMANAMQKPSSLDIIAATALEDLKYSAASNDEMDEKDDEVLQEDPSDIDGEICALV